MQTERETSLIIGLAVVFGGLMMIVLLTCIAFAVDARDGMFFRNPTSGMEPTVLTGDYVTVRRLHVGDDARVLRRGDLIVHEFPEDEKKKLLKRVIGLPGDTLAMDDGVMTVNGQHLKEVYTQHVDSTDPVTNDFLWQRRYLVGDARRDSLRYRPSRDTWGSLLVPAGEVFVLGDNRTRSLDSRWFGFVATSEVLGRVRRVYFSRDSVGRVRWSRIGHLIQ